MAFNRREQMSSSPVRLKSARCIFLLLDPRSDGMTIVRSGRKVAGERAGIVCVQLWSGLSLSCPRSSHPFLLHLRRKPRGFFPFLFQDRPGLDHHGTTMQQCRPSARSPQPQRVSQWFVEEACCCRSLPVLSGAEWCRRLLSWRAPLRLKKMERRPGWRVACCCSRSPG